MAKWNELYFKHIVSHQGHNINIKPRCDHPRGIWKNTDIGLQTLMHNTYNPEGSKNWKFLSLMSLWQTHLDTKPNLLELESVSHSVMSDLVTPGTVACQVPLPMEFSRWEYWSHFLLQGNLPDPGSKIQLELMWGYLKFVFIPLIVNNYVSCCRNTNKIHYSEAPDPSDVVIHLWYIHPKASWN